MARLEDLKEGATVKGVRPDGPITIINVKWHGESVVELTYKDSSGRPGNELIFREREAILEVIQPGQPWSFDADAAMLRLVSEAYRIRMNIPLDGFERYLRASVTPGTAAQIIYIGGRLEQHNTAGDNTSAATLGCLNVNYA